MKHTRIRYMVVWLSCVIGSSYAIDITIDNSLTYVSYNTISYSYAWNQNHGIILYGSSTIVSEPITIQGQTIICKKQINWLYYSNARWLRLLPLDQTSLISLQLQSASYSWLSLQWGLYTDCDWVGDTHYVYGQVSYSRSGASSDGIIMWLAINTSSGSLIDPIVRANNMYYSDLWWLSGLLYDSVGWVGVIVWVYPPVTVVSSAPTGWGGWWWPSPQLSSNPTSNSSNPTSTNDASNEQYHWSAWVSWDNSLSASQPTDQVLISSGQINETIIDWLCYTRDTQVSIIDSSTRPASSEFKQALIFLKSFDMTKYSSVDQYHPEQLLTREQTAKIVSNFAMNVLCRNPDLALKPSFNDIENADPSLKPYIVMAYQLWLMKWSKSSFRPFDPITKAELNAILIRLILNKYLPENTTQHRYDNYDSTSVRLGIIKYPNPYQQISREDTALMLYRAYIKQQFALEQQNGELHYILDQEISSLKS